MLHSETFKINNRPMNIMNRHNHWISIDDKSMLRLKYSQQQRIYYRNVITNVY